MSSIQQSFEPAQPPAGMTVMDFDLLSGGPEDVKGVTANLKDPTKANCVELLLHGKLQCCYLKL